MANPYVKQTWTEGVSQTTAARMGVMEQGIYDAHIAPACRVGRGVLQTITTATATPVAFTSEDFDQDGLGTSTMHDNAVNNTRITARVAGIYVCGGYVTWSASPTTGTIQVRLNGAAILAVHQVAADYRSMNVHTMYTFAVNDYVELIVTQASGSNKDINAFPGFWMARVG